MQHDIYRDNNVIEWRHVSYLQRVKSGVSNLKTPSFKIMRVECFCQRAIKPIYVREMDVASGTSKLYRGNVKHFRGIKEALRVVTTQTQWKK